MKIITSLVIFSCSFLMLSCGTAENSSDSKVFSEKEFTIDFLEKLEKKFADKDFKMSKNLEIQSGNAEGGSILNLSNAYIEYKKNPEKIDQVFDNFSELVKQNVETIIGEATLDKVIPLIKNKNYLKEIASKFGDGQHGQIYEDYNNDLIIVYAVDHPNTIVSLSQEDFTKLDVDYAALREAAKTNLFNLIGDQLGFQEKDGLFHLRAGGIFESSMILFPSLWNKENFDIKGDIIISIPNRGNVIVMDSENKEKKQSLKMLTRTLHGRGTYSISDKMFKWDEKNKIFNAIN